MHILVTNDDGPPSSHSSPYIIYWVREFQRAGHTVSVCLPDTQRSWIGKAHLHGQTLTPTYYIPPADPFAVNQGTVRKYPAEHHHKPHEKADGGGDVNEGGGGGDEAKHEHEQWILLNGTPASAVQVGLHYYFTERGPIDLVVSGPNYGRNVTACFALSSGTLGAALEAASCGVRSVAVSFAFTEPNVRDEAAAAAACRRGVAVVEALVRDWPADGTVDLYTVNVPLTEAAEAGKVLFTEMLQNYWSRGKSGCIYRPVEPDQLGTDPDLEEARVRAVHEAGRAEPAAEDGKKEQTTDQEAKDGKTTEKMVEGGEGDVAKGSLTTKTTLVHRHFRWDPDLSGVFQSVEESKPGNDGWAVEAGHTSITPLKANFWNAATHLYGTELELAIGSGSEGAAAAGGGGAQQQQQQQQSIHAVVAYEDSYVQPLIIAALRAAIPASRLHLITPPSPTDPSSPIRLGGLLPAEDAAVVQIGAYERLDFDFAAAHPTTALVSSYVFRKALIRKHHLASTVEQWAAKQRPGSILAAHVPRAEPFELDYAEFLDDALVDAFDLRASLEKNEQQQQRDDETGGGGGGGGTEWWILKPAMSDRGQGIRLFSTMAELQAIFEGWEEAEPEDQDQDQDQDQDHGEGENKDEAGPEGVVTSHLRHFVAQPYIHPPLLLPGSGHKFHLRVYVLCVGRLRVYVYQPALALAAAKPYAAPRSGADGIDLSAHLTNTCLQGNRSPSSSSSSSLPAAPGPAPTVQLFWDLDLDRGLKEDVFRQVCAVAGEAFEAAARVAGPHFQPLPNAFEPYGLDFLVDAAGTAWLLEVNAYPDFGQTGETLRDAVVGGFWTAAVRAAAGAFFDGLLAVRGGAGPEQRGEGRGATAEGGDEHGREVEAGLGEGGDGGLVCVREVELEKRG